MNATEFARIALRRSYYWNIIVFDLDTREPRFVDPDAANVVIR